ncbi:PREDICTED: antigen KI-67 [Charadrius vociferus]|nr:PREDICTED: antigen KI-67 [Charadrius vociferus]
MPLFGNIIVIKRNGTDGISFPLTASSCLFGRRTECDIRIQLPQVSKEHCKIEVNENKEAILTNLSTVNPTQLNGACFQQPVPLKHGDVLTIIDRSFRFEYPLQSTPRKRRSRTPKDETLQEVSRDVGKSHSQDHKELSTPGKSKGTEVTTTPSKEDDGNGNAAFLLKQCSIECLDYTDKSKIYGSAIELDKLAQTTNTTNVLSTPRPKRKSPRSHFISPTKETSGVNPADTDAPTTPKRVLLKRKSFSEIAAETQRQDSVCRNDSLKQLPLAENKCLKQRRNSKQHTPGKPVKEVVLKEICDQANFVTSTEGHSETPASFSNSKSPRRNNRQSKKLLNKSVHSETLASEELTSELASPASQKSDSGRKRGAPRTSGLLTEKSLETNAVQEHRDKTTDRKESGTKEELAAKGYHQKQDLEDASVMRPRRLSSKRRSSGSATVPKDDEAVSELNISGVLAEEESGKTKRVSQKRKSGDLLPQPLGKKKRVSFGGQLSPELFDKSLPPNSPLKKGATPARLSLPFGNSPRAVLKKAQGLKRFAVQELSEHLLKEKMSPKNSPSRKSPAALSPASGKATPKLTLGSPAPYIKGRFSVSHITTPLPIAEEKDAVAEDVNTNEKNGARVRTPKSSHINEDVVKSWAEVVKLGVARPQSKTAKKSVRKGRSLKKITQSPKLNMNMDESFTGEMMVSPLSSSDASEQKQDSPGICHLLRKESLNSVFDAIATKTPEKRKAILEEDSSMDRLSIIPAKQACRVKSGSKRSTPKQKLEPAEVMSGIKQLLRTPEQRSEPAEALSGIKQLMKTPKRKLEPLEALSGIKQLMKTPKQKPEPVEALSGIKQLMKTPKQKPEPVEALSGIKQLMKTPKQKPEPVEALLGIKQLMKTPKQKPEPVEALSGIKQLMKTPKQKLEPVEDLLGIKQLMRTPQQKPEPVEVLSGVKQLLRTPQQDRIFKTPKEKVEPIEDVFGISRLVKTPREKYQPVDDFVGLQRLMAEPRQKCSDFEVDYVGVPEMFDTPEEMKHPDQEKVETVSHVEPHGPTQRPGRGKRKEAKEVKHPSENVESCGKDSSVLCKEPANMKQTLQKDGINDILETADDPTIKTVSVSSSIQNENCQLQTDVKTSESKSNDGGIEDREEMLLSPGKRFRGVKKVENTEPLIPPKRGRRARNDQVKQASSEDIHGTTRKLRKDPAAKMIQRDERTFDKDTETATAEVSENGTKLGIQITEKRVKSLRSARKHSTEVKADSCGMGLEKIRNIPKTEETSAETDAETHSCITNEIKVSQGDETENAQENTTEASQRLKAESPSGEANENPVTALNLEANRSTVQETNRTRNRRGKNGSLEKKHDEFAEDINSLELITPQNKSEAEMDESSLKDSLSSICVKNTYQVTKDQNDPAGTSIPAANSDSLARGRQKWTRNEQGILKPNQTEVLQENETQTNQIACRRGRGRKVTFEPEEASSKAVGGKRSFPGDDKDGQHETSENPSLQVRRSRRKQVDSVPQIACSTFMGKQTLIADHSKDEAFVKEQDSSLGATPSSTEDNPLRRGKRREVAAASQTSRSLSIRTRRGFLEGDDKKMAVREDQNPALGNETLQAKANASARDKRKKIDLAAEAKSSSSLQRKCGLSETDDKEESTNEEQNTPLETASCAKEKPLGRGRKKETALASHTTNNISLRGKSVLPADNVALRSVLCTVSNMTAEMYQQMEKWGERELEFYT